MRRIGDFAFPETPEEAKDWKPEFVYALLHPKVAAIGVTRIEGAWKGYILPVPGGVSRELVEDLYETDGEKLVESFARAIWPFMADVPYAR